MRITDIADAWLMQLVPRAKDRRAMTFGLALMGSMTLLGRGVPAWREWERGELLAAAESARRLDGAHSDIDGHRSVVALRASLRGRLDSLSGAYLHATSAAEAGAALATLVSDLGDDCGIHVTSASVRPDSIKKTAFTRIAVRISATGDVEGLSDYLRSIESADHLLAVRELSVSQTEPSAPDSRAEALRFEVLVEGLVRIETSERRGTTLRVFSSTSLKSTRQ